MELKYYDIVIVGGGPAGMAAAVAAKRAGIDKVVILEQQDFLGGVLPQCIHDGFGLHIFNQNLTGPEYAVYYKKLLAEMNIEYYLSTTVMEINDKKEVACVGKTLGAVTIKAGAVILAMGCRERTRGALRIPGTRPAGVYTAGAAQHMMNIQNYLPGKSIVILGLGDIGLIMARRLTLEGAKVKLVLGLEASGLVRNMVQCIDDFDIPLKLGYSVVSLHGVRRLKGVTIAKIYDDGSTETKSKEYIPCDTLLLAAGLLPESEIAQKSGVNFALDNGIKTDDKGQTDVEGIYACGNVVEVHDLVDFVTLDGEKAGLSAAMYIKQKREEAFSISNEPEHKINSGSGEQKGYSNLLKDTEMVKYRVCILCPKGCQLKGELMNDNWVIGGHQCQRGEAYGIQEILNPMRVITTTVKVKGDKRKLLPVKTDGVIPKDRIWDVMKCCKKITVQPTVEIGSIIISNVANTGVNIIACDTL